MNKTYSQGWFGLVATSILCSVAGAYLFDSLKDHHWIQFGIQSVVIFGGSLFVAWLNWSNIFALRWIRRLLWKETRLDWTDVFSCVSSINSQLRNSGFIPTHILGIGRGGAIMGALISGNLIDSRLIPFTVLERKYSKNKVGMRNAEILDGVKLGKCNLSQVLLVAGDVGTGLTAEVFKQYLKDQGAEEIRFAVLAKSSNCAMDPDYFGFTFESEKKLRLPWMLSSFYQRYKGDTKL